MKGNEISKMVFNPLLVPFIKILITPEVNLEYIIIILRFYKWFLSVFFIFFYNDPKMYYVNLLLNFSGWIDCWTFSYNCIFITLRSIIFVSNKILFSIVCKTGEATLDEEMKKSCREQLFCKRFSVGLYLDFE